MRSALRTLGIVGVSAATGYVLLKLFQRSPLKQKLAAAFEDLCTDLDQKHGWSTLPTPVGLVLLIGVRNRLRAQNLYSTDSPSLPSLPAPPPPENLSYRTSDGTYNDLKCPFMGASNARFGRNAPISATWQEPPETILTPSPRVVSTELLTRHEFTPATTLNLFAAAWLQFQIRDWFSHGKSPKENPWQIPLGPNDPWPSNPMTILRTMPDPTRTADDDGTPDTHVNTESHWWDASQIYGSNLGYRDKVRTRTDGKLLLGKDHLIHPDPESLVQLSAAPLAGWWLGLELFFTLFTLEHNSICDELKQQYPQWSDDELFEHARLINAALIAKIHTVEWTTAILGHPVLQIGMRSNWWGLLGEHIANLFGRLSKSELISGIPGSDTDHFGVPYSLTEEFVAVYRMHPLIPDDITFWSLATGQVLEKISFPQIAGNETQAISDSVPMNDLLYSFGIMNPGAVQLHNYPQALQHFIRPDGVHIDLAAHDILRCRELGVPRYTKFREILHLKPVRTFEELTDNPVWREEIRRVYSNDIDTVDVIVGLFAETPPKGFGFSDTAFRIFVLMASRRLNSDRFFTTDFTEEVYSKAGMDWIRDNTFSTVLLRHFPALAPSLAGVKNAFAPWTRISASPTAPAPESVAAAAPAYQNT